MTAAIQAAPAVGAGVLLALAAILAGLLVWASTGSDAPTWAPGELAAVAVEVEPAGPGRHRVVAERAHEAVATWARYQARHSFAEVPPSIATPLALMTPTERAHELVRQLGAATWTPYRGLPARLRVELTAATIARRNRVPLLLGTYQLAGRLP